jgi:hypothetical protein
VPALGGDAKNCQQAFLAPLPGIDHVPTLGGDAKKYQPWVGPYTCPVGPYLVSGHCTRHYRLEAVLSCSCSVARC